MSISPSRKFYTDTNENLETRGLRVKQRSSFDVIWTFTYDGAVLDLTDADTVTLTYSDGTTRADILGSVSNAAGGVVSVSFDELNTDVASGVYDFDLKVENTSSLDPELMCCSYGQLHILGRADDEVTNNFITTYNIAISSGTERDVLVTNHHVTFVYTGGSDFTFNLPSISGTTYLGTSFRFINLTSNILALSCSALDQIDDSTIGGGIYSGEAGINDSSYSAITIEAVAANRWIAVEGRRTWTTI